MCSILGSFTKEDLVEMARLNEYRGQHSHSISYYSLAEKKLVSVRKDMGPLPVDQIDIPKGCYCICHQQAPTTEAKTVDFVHPAQFDGSFLWHNGILKQKAIEYIKFNLDIRSDYQYDSDTSWDTKLLLQLIAPSVYADMRELGNVDGTFACVYAQCNKDNVHDLFLFRNELAPLFIDDKYNISSTRFDGSRSLEPGVVWRFKPGVEITDSGIHFKTAENPYYFG